MCYINFALKNNALNASQTRGSDMPQLSVKLTDKEHAQVAKAAKSTRRSLQGYAAEVLVQDAQKRNKAKAKVTD